jgi:hypothetical protein
MTYNRTGMVHGNFNFKFKEDKKMKKIITVVITTIMIAIVAIAATGCNKASKNTSMSGKLLETRNLMDVVSFEEDDTHDKKDDQRWSSEMHTTHHCDGLNGYYELLDYLRGC